MITEDRIIYEDNHLIAVYKNSGDLVQVDDSDDTSLEIEVKKYLKKKYNKPGDAWLGVIHRIDRPVTGLVLFAKTDKALSRMNKLFASRDVKKTYYAITKDRPRIESDKLVNWLKKDRETNVVRAYEKEVKESKKAELSYKILLNADGRTLLEIVPVTGRPHQIRVQLAKMGCTIEGDLKYGDNKPNRDKSICLHSKSLEFIHPVKQEKVILEAALPNNPYWNHFKNF